MFTVFERVSNFALFDYLLYVQSLNLCLFHVNHILFVLYDDIHYITFMSPCIDILW